MITNEELDDKVDEWHDSLVPGSLHEYLGMTWEEYSYWTETAKIPQSFLDRQ